MTTPKSLARDMIARHRAQQEAAAALPCPPPLTDAEEDDIQITDPRGAYYGITDLDD